MFVIRPWLVLGKYQETLNRSLLQAQTIGAMLQFAEQVEHLGIPTLYIPLEDGKLIAKEIFQKGIAFILTHYRQEKKILVSCGAGISRSVTFIIAALKETEDITLLDAYQIVLNVNPKALPHPVVWQSLCAFYNENSPYWLLLKQYNKKG